MTRVFRDLLQGKFAEGKFVCVGLDSKYQAIPAFVKEEESGVENQIWRFNHDIAMSTRDLVGAYKPNLAFYMPHGPAGLEALRTTINSIKLMAPDVPIILDLKCADIGNTNDGWVEFAFDYLKADAVTVHPYLGGESLAPFLARKDKGVFVLCRTSNPGAYEFQNLSSPSSPLVDCLYEHVAHQVTHEWNKNGNCGLVVGATYPEELDQVRKIVGDMPILIPGIGAQGGDLEKTVLAGKDSRNQGMIINSSRQIIFASNGPNFAEAARFETQKLHDSITRILKGGNS